MIKQLESVNASWLVLLRAPDLGPVGQKRLLELFGTPQQILSAGKKALNQTGLMSKTVNYLSTPDWDRIATDLEWLAKPNHYLITYKEKTYPRLLQETAGAPLVLFVCGNPKLLQTVQLGIVGSRNPSPVGRQIAREFSRQLAQCGITITSGMALGIDYSSHMGALDANGRTIAVLGNGLDIIYPARHKVLAENLTENGALVSEFPPGTRPLANHFPRRNRIISGLSTGILVVEAAQKSGSLITARYAMEQGREVFSIPGSINNPLAKGCHKLIKQGAKLVESVQDIIEEIGPLIYATNSLSLVPENRNKKDESLDHDYKLLLDNIGYESISIDYLIEQTGLTADAVSSMLLILELKGLVKSCPGGFYTKFN